MTQWIKPIKIMWGVVFAILSLSPELALAARSPGSAQSQHGFVDGKLGVRLGMPNGWSLLTDMSSIASIPGAKVMAEHKPTGCYAVLVVQDVILTIPSLDAYLDLAFQARKKSFPSMVETKRESVTFAGLPGRRMYDNWETQGLRLRGFSTACSDGFYYYLLSGWCIESASQGAFAAFTQLEKNLKITKSYDDRLEEMMGPVVEDYPYISMAGGKLLGKQILTKRLTISEAREFGLQTMKRGKELLDQGDRDELENIFELAFSSLPPADLERFLSYEKRPLDLSDAERLDAGLLMKTALSNLSAERRARLQELGDKAIELALGSGPELQEDSRPIKLTGLLEALRLGGLSQDELIERVRRCGVAFLVTPEVEDELRRGGAPDALIKAIRANHRAEN